MSPTSKKKKVAFKMAATAVITMRADENTLSQRGWLGSRADAYLFTFHLSYIHVRICVHGCVG